MSKNDANGAIRENAQVGAGNVDVPPVPPLNPDTIMASAEGGMFSLQVAEQYVTLSEEQRKMFTACFFQENVTRSG